MKKLRFLAALALGLSLFSCNRELSSSVNQDRIFTVYELFYNANEDKTYARATFHFSNELGTKLELADPSKVTFDGDPLTFNAVFAYYEREYAGFVQSGSFEWVDTEGNPFSNTIEIHDIGYGAGIDTIGRSSSYELAWSGAALAANEIVTVTINGENEQDAQVFATSNIGANSIILAKDKLEKIGHGPGTVYMDRSYIPTIADAPSAGGRLTGRYRPENLDVFMD
ncbi:MAG: hypothetical protein KDC66_05115 [Phaeodactylibacter sp.]|nr:hypothetical protein [Phaeodactylibacter sp.]MCB9272516.1 hypothetical protein [Lewinellaceae bacterium]